MLLLSEKNRTRRWSSIYTCHYFLFMEKRPEDSGYIHIHYLGFKSVQRILIFNLPCWKAHRYDAGDSPCALMSDDLSSGSPRSRLQRLQMSNVALSTK